LIEGVALKVENAGQLLSPKHKQDFGFTPVISISRPPAAT